jgi:hypothetical protein
VTGVAREGRDHRYRFAVWVARSPAGRLTFTLHLSNGFLISGPARGKASFPCPATVRPRVRHK